MAMGSTVAAANVTCSPNSCPIVFNLGESCKNSSGGGANQYYFVFNTTLPAGTSVTVTSWTWTPNAADHAFVQFTPITAAVTAEGRLVYQFTDNEKSATNGNLLICFSWSGPDVESDSDCLNTGNNNYSSCGNRTPTTTPGAGSGTLPATKVWPLL
ncbi:hypothetical protein [Ornithinimicrobium pekingense]|uniref:hypothetical protein n=1 Tax=Ornithinimicrobium pekingense TaxID=384677 RepID=UPI000409223A|nr:hypothetical protein [Ornithinimicrobium pekingense]